MYYLPEKYIENKFSSNTNYDDTSCEDEYQDDVYKFAKEICDNNNLKTVLDIGCGSGFKLIKYFNDKDTVGVEIGKTLLFLKNKYKNKTWIESSFSDKLDRDFDLIICSDVIEHLPNPEELLRFISNINFKYLVLSTPERDEVQMYHFGRKFNGPPSNKEHVREWNRSEFGMFVGDYFKVEDHFLSNSHFSHSKKICQTLLLTKKD